MAGTIVPMPEVIHETTLRLYQAAKKLCAVEGKSAVARLLVESPQVVNNWESRGVSEKGALKAQEVIGCSATWILGATPEMVPGWPFRRVDVHRFIRLTADQRAYVEGRLEAAIEACEEGGAPAKRPASHESMRDRDSLRKTRAA